MPMLKEDELVGAIGIYRQEVRAFTHKQIELLSNFAAQAVVAIENARLLKELRQRTDDLSEALEQQTATSEVLKVISSSRGELQPVFDAMLANGVRICEAKFGVMLEYDGKAYRALSTLNASPGFVAFHREPRVWGPDTGLGRLALTKRTVHVEDARQGRAFNEHDPGRMAIVETANVRTFVAVPMLKDGELIGAIVIFRQEVRPFSDKQIELVQNFAAQAVIAIENTRLLSELRQRTADLTESLEQQTATSEVLKVISASPGDLGPVFDAMLVNATSICEATFGVMTLHSGGWFTTVALHNAPPKFAEARRLAPRFQTTGNGPLGRSVQTKQPQQVIDLREEEAYIAGDPAMRAIVDQAGARSLIDIPMINDGEVVGVIGIYRQEVRPFTDKQIELVQNFAAQAVIAIENVRLLNELRESLQQQTATADVLKVISRSTFDLQVVLKTLAESATKLCSADKTAISRPMGNVFEHLASYGYTPEHSEYMLTHPIPATRASVSGRVLQEGKVVHIPDVAKDPEYTLADKDRFNVRTLLGVPLMREGGAVGVIILQRETVEPFTEKQIDLATTFADQAGIAIENVRLFDEIQEKGRQLAEASQHKSQFLASMSHELRTPLNAILGYTELIADGIYGAPPEKMQAVLKRVESNGRHLLGLINAVLDLSKIEAGQFTLDLSKYSLENLAQTVYNAVEPLASDKKLTFRADIQPDLPSGHGDERRLTQVLLNLVGNAIKFTDAGDVVIKAAVSNAEFHLSVRDTGPGISAADQAKLFQEFQQADNPKTRKKEGTGLGLAISKRIVEMHGGRIWMESQLGIGSTFFVTLPVQVQEPAKP